MRSMLASSVLLVLAFHATAEDGDVVPRSQLEEPIFQGDLAKVRALVESGVSVDDPISKSETPLVLAVEMGQLEIARYLIEKGADVEGICAPFAAVLELDAASKQPAFQEEVERLAKEIGFARPPEDRPEGGTIYNIAQDEVPGVLAAHRERLKEKGFMLVRLEQNFGYGGELDPLVLLPTSDPWVAMAAIGTNGANYQLACVDLIAWLQELQKEQPFELTGIGFDYLEGRFLSEIKDPAALAANMYEFCPDIVDQGIGDVEALARELAEKKTLYFWWD